MTPVVRQVPVTAAVGEAARVMVEHDIHRLVVTQGGQTVGMLTSMDLLRALAALQPPANRFVARFVGARAMNLVGPSAVHGWPLATTRTAADR